MRSLLQERSGNSRQRGFWLRCFLGGITILFALVSCPSENARANVCVYKTLHVIQTRGHVTDYSGKSIPDAKLTFKNDGKTVLESSADQEGNFNVKVPKGKYELRVESPGFAPGYAYLQVGFGFRTFFRSKSILMRLSPGVVCKSNEPMTKQEGLRLQG
jgi:hypothetical protein